MRLLAVALAYICQVLEFLDIYLHELYMPSLAKFEFVTAVWLNTQVFWDVVLCYWVKSYRRFGGKYCMRLQSQGAQEGVDLWSSRF